MNAETEKREERLRRINTFEMTSNNCDSTILQSDTSGLHDIEFQAKKDAMKHWNKDGQYIMR
jgi:hypothetical protein